MRLKIGQTIYRLQYKPGLNKRERFVGIETCVVLQEVGAPPPGEKLPYNHSTSWKILGETGEIYWVYTHHSLEGKGFYTDYDYALELGVKKADEMLKMYLEKAQEAEKIYTHFIVLHELNEQKSAKS
jgi:hypothetical protein